MSTFKNLLASSLLFSAITLPNIANAATVYVSPAYSAGESQNLAFFSGPSIPTGIFPTAVGESFSLGATTNISSMDFLVDGFNSNQTIQVFFHQLSQNPSTAAPIYSQTFTFLQYKRTDNVLTGAFGNTDNINFTFTSPFTLQAGSYGVFLAGPNGDFSVSRFGPGPNPSNGSSSSSGPQFTDFGNTQVQVNADGQAISFTGYASGLRLNGSQVQVSAVPEPSTAWLFALGLPLIFSLTRKKLSYH